MKRFAWMLAFAPLACFTGSRTDLFDDATDGSMPMSQDDAGADVISDAGIVDTGGKSGDTLQLTIKKLSNNTQYGIEIFVLLAAGSGKQTMYWASTGAN